MQILEKKGFRGFQWENNAASLCCRHALSPLFTPQSQRRNLAFQLKPEYFCQNWQQRKDASRHQAKHANHALECDSLRVFSPPLGLADEGNYK